MTTYGPYQAANVQGTIYNGSSGTITYSCASSDNADIIYAKNSDSVAATWAVDGGGATSFGGTTAGSPTVQLLNISLGTLGTHSIVITAPGSGNTYQMGLVCRAGTTGAEIINLAVPSAAAGAFGTVAGNLSWVSIFNPAVVITSIGTNDAADTTGYAAKITQILSSTSAYPQIVYDEPAQASNAAGQAIVWAANFAACIAAGTNCQYLGIQNRWSTVYATANAAGWMLDGQHPSVAGDNDMAGYLFRSFFNYAAAPGGPGKGVVYPATTFNNLITPSGGIAAFTLAQGSKYSFTAGTSTIPNYFNVNSQGNFQTSTQNLQAGILVGNNSGSYYGVDLGINSSNHGTRIFAAANAGDFVSFCSMAISTTGQTGCTDYLKTDMVTGLTTANSLTVTNAATHSGTTALNGITTATAAFNSNSAITTTNRFTSGAALSSDFTKYWNTNTGNNISGTQLSPGIIFYNSSGNIFGADAGYSTHFSQYVTRLLNTFGLFCLSNVASTATQQSDFGELNCWNSGKQTRYNSIDTVSGGIPAIYGTSDLTAQTAALSTTALYTPAATGMFRVSYYAKVTTAGTSSVLGGTTGFVLHYTDGTDSVAQNLTLGGTDQTGTPITIASGNVANTTGTVYLGSAMVYAKTGVAMTYDFGYSSTGTTMQYEIHVKVEAL